MAFRQKFNLQNNQLLAKGRTAEVFAWGDGLILKLFHNWCPPDWVESEARIARSLTDSGLPIPKVIETVEIDQRQGIVYERVDGISMLEACMAKPWLAERHGRLLADLHGEIHRHQAETLPCLQSRLYAAIRGLRSLSAARKDQILNALSGLPEGNQLCHMDFHPDQILLTKKGPCIIDWETACKGNPLADVARTSILIQVGQIPMAGYISEQELNTMRDSLLTAYLSQYPENYAKDSAQEIASWELVLVAARLAEGIYGEELRLKSIIDEKLGVD